MRLQKTVTLQKQFGDKLLRLASSAIQKLKTFFSTLIHAFEEEGKAD